MQLHETAKKDPLYHVNHGLFVNSDVKFFLSKWMLACGWNNIINTSLNKTKSLLEIRFFNIHIKKLQSLEQAKTTDTCCSKEATSQSEKKIQLCPGLKS